MKDNGGNKMKFYETTLNIEFQKKVKIRANNGDEAMNKLVDIFTNTDMIALTEDDIVSVSTEAERLFDKDSDCNCDNDECDGDCENCEHFSEREFLYEELY